MSKVNRDFVVKGDYLPLINVEAGIEHFGPGVETNVDIVIADPIYESFSIAEKVVKLCIEMGIEKVCNILKKVQSKNTESVITIGKAVSVRTGMNSEIGKIAKLIQETEKEQTPLQQKLAKLGGLLSVITVIICGIVFLTGPLKGANPKVICSDKTGTLTHNEMTVKKI